MRLSAGLTRIGIAVFLLPACVGINPPRFSVSAPDADCEQILEWADRVIDRNGVGDAAAARIPGFPELRLDRFLASFAGQDMTQKAYVEWLSRMRALDEQARQIELQNLPAADQSDLQASFGVIASTVVSECGKRLAERDLYDSDRRSRLIATVKSPDAYSTWQRVIGVYYLSRWAVVDGVKQLHRELREPFLNPAQHKARSRPLLRYQPPEGPVLDRNTVAGILARSSDNPLTIPQPDSGQLAALFATFAPIWSIDVESGSDRIGKVRAGGNGEVSIDSANPVVYRLSSYTRYAGEVLLQLNYVIWFPDRPSIGWLDIYAGRFDGLIWRVTLRMDGRPLAYDSIHACGCYYQIFPGEGVRVVQPQDGSEPILSPVPILSPGPGHHVVVSLSAGNHFIDGITAEPGLPGAMTYGWMAYDALRSLPVPGDGYRSLFDPQGLVAGSERPERFLLWPMGVPSAGAMRQWGTHAVAFLGKRHFDDPWLMENLLRPLPR